MKKDNTERLKGGLRIKEFFNKKSVPSKPLVSIITVCLNSDKYIEKTIKSVFEQTYKNIEYIIIDGGSRDKTLDIIRKYENKISVWISETDKSLYDAMNKGIRLSNGEIIGIINSDDWYEMDAIEEVIHFFKKNPRASVVHGNRNLWDERSKKLKAVILPSKNYNRLIYHTMPISHPTCFIKKSIYLKYGLFDIGYKFSADKEFFLRLYKENIIPSYLNKIIANMRAGGRSYTLSALKESRQISKRYNSPLLGRITYFAFRYLVFFIAKNFHSSILQKIYYKINPRYAKKHWYYPSI